MALAGAGAVALTGCSSGSGSTPASTSRAVGPEDPAVARAEKRRAVKGSTVTRYALTAAAATVELGSREVATWAYGAAIPGKEMRVTAGDTLEVALSNDLPEATSIHWHGLAIRNDMDGVPDLTQPQIGAGKSFTYRFTVPDPGTYWFHPHMGLQLDRGLYCPLIVEERSGAGAYDVDQVLILDDWLDGTGTTPDETLASLKAMEGMDMGSGSMSGMQSDLLGGDAGDVSYPLHLLNGRPSEDRPTIAVPAGGRARLRLINAGSDTAYRVAVTGQKMTVTHADGFEVEPAEVDTVLIGMGERYDVIVEPSSGSWPIVALAEGKPGAAEAVLVTSDVRGGSAPAPGSRPPALDGRLLAYSDLVAAESSRLDRRAPNVDEQLVLTGSMTPYAWSFDSKPYPERPPVEISEGQRVRLRFENRSDMWHPIHVHGHTFRLGRADTGPRKDTVNVLPGETVEVDFDAVNPGQWMIHCHNTYHLEGGMAALVSYVR